MELWVGKKIQHAHTKEYLWVLIVAIDKVLCRTKDLREIWFYKHELEDINGIRESTHNTRFL